MGATSEGSERSELRNVVLFDWRNPFSRQFTPRPTLFAIRFAHHSLLDMFEDKDICRIADMKPGEDALEDVKSTCGSDMQPNLSLIHWLLDLMCEVVMNEKVNKMSAKNMAIVMSPNLYSINSENPMAALTMSQKVADFTTVVLKSRLLVKYKYGA